MGRSGSPSHYHGEEHLKFCLEEHYLQIWDTRVLISNNGKQFDNNAFRDFCSELGVRNQNSSPAHPQANGQVEVTNQSLLKIINTWLEGQRVSGRTSYQASCGHT